MMKDKVKDFMKKVTSSSPSPFKGQGHVLGSSSTSTSTSTPTSRPPPNPNPNPNPIPTPKPQISTPNPNTTFSSYSPLISTTATATSTSSTATTTSSLSCPVCSTTFASESDVSNHLDSCLVTNATNSIPSRVAEYLSSNPPDSAVEVVKKLLANVSRDPENDKFRRVRLANPRIKEAVVDVKGGVELFEAVGFRVGEEGEEGELFATMAVVPEEDTVGVIRQAVLMLERMRPMVKKEEEKKESQDVVVRGGEAKKIDREVSFY